MNTVLGQKKIQSERFLMDGTRIPVTAIDVAGNRVVCIKNKDTNGYWAVQLGIGSKKHTSKGMAGHIKGAIIKNAPIFIKEARISDEDSVNLPQIGSILTISDILKPGDIVEVIGVSKGKGWAGGVKRYHFKGGPRTHGQSDRERAPGSIGQTTTPGRVYKGKKMAGRMGHQQVTLQNLQVVDVSESLVYIKGLVPGSINSYVVIRKIGEDKKFVGLHQPVRVEESTPEEVQVSSPAQETTEQPQVIESKEKSTEELPKEAAQEEPEVKEAASVTESVSDEPKEETKDAS